MNALANSIIIACFALIGFWACDGFKRDNLPQYHTHVERMNALQSDDMAVLIDKAEFDAKLHHDIISAELTPKQAAAYVDLMRDDGKNDPLYRGRL